LVYAHVLARLEAVRINPADDKMCDPMGKGLLFPKPAPAITSSGEAFAEIGNLRHALRRETSLRPSTCQN